MDKYLLGLISLLVFAGCNNAANYATLESIDSLIVNNRIDSAYTVLQSFNSDDLSSKNNAYYSLLLTTAQYKNYVPISNDSIIDIAVNYYTDHFDQDKLTRSLLYKGAVLSELGLHQEAIEMFKHAEIICDTTDYLSLGLINTRMGELYQRMFVVNDEHIKRYKRAIAYFKLLNNKANEYPIYTNIGQLYRLKDRDSSYYYLNISLDLATQFNDSLSVFNNKSMLSEAYILDGNYTKAINLSLNILDNCTNLELKTKSIHCLVRSYANINKFDSAKYFLCKIKSNQNIRDSISYLLSLSEIEKQKGNLEKYVEYYHLSNKLADSVLNSAMKLDLLRIEKRYDNKIATSNIEKYKLQILARNYLAAIIFILAVCSIIINILLWKRKKRQLYEKITLIEQLRTEMQLQNTNFKSELVSNLNTISYLHKSIDSKTDLENNYKTIIENRIIAMRELMNIRYQFESKPKLFTERFCQLMEENKKAAKGNNTIIDIANALNFNIITILKQEHSSLTQSNMMILALSCLKFSAPEMCVYLGLSSVNSVYVLRSKLLKRLNTELPSIESFIEYKLTKIHNTIPQ